MFSNLPGWQRRPWQPDPHTTLINILSNPLLALTPHTPPPTFLFLLSSFSSLCWPLMSRSRHRAGRLMISPHPPPPNPPASSSCLPPLNFVKLSPRRTFSLCPPAAYQRTGSPAPPPACLCRPGWTRAGRFSAGLGGLSDTRQCKRECPGQREKRGRLRVLFQRLIWPIYTTTRREIQHSHCG